MEPEQFLKYNFLPEHCIVFSVMDVLLGQFNMRKKSEHLC